MKKTRQRSDENRRQLSRREFLQAAGGAAATLGMLPLWPGNVAAQAQSGLEEAGLSHRCVSGDVTAHGAVVWLRAQEESWVSVRYGPEPSLSEFSATTSVIVGKETDFTAKLYLEGLQPQTTYYYRAVVDGKKPGPMNAFVTAPAEEAAADVQFAFGGDTRQSYQPFVIMDAVREMKPDFFVHLGDTIYADREWVAKRLPQFWAKYAANRSDRPTQRLLSGTSLYVIWDDHEVADNYDPWDPLAPIGRKAFFDYWPVRRDPSESDRIYRSFRWGRAVELFLLDTRQYRDYSAGTILGKEQKQWFLEALSASNASFKFVASSVPFSSPLGDKWGGYPSERDEILQLIRDKQITGVIFLTADLHYAAVARLPGGSGLKEVIVGPLAAARGLQVGRTARFEFFSRQFFTYGMIRVYAKSQRPYLEIAILNDKNKVLYKSKLDAGM
jgi:alkaline phosphatase D